VYTFDFLGTVHSGLKARYPIHFLSFFSTTDAILQSVCATPLPRAARPHFTNFTSLHFTSLHNNSSSMTSYPGAALIIPHRPASSLFSTSLPGDDRSSRASHVHSFDLSGSSVTCKTSLTISLPSSFSHHSSLFFFFFFFLSYLPLQLPLLYPISLTPDVGSARHPNHFSAQPLFLDEDKDKQAKGDRWITCTHDFLRTLHSKSTPRCLSPRNRWSTSL
jgi:hypothetical protein